MVGRVQGVFEHDRARLLETVQREAQRAVETYDKDAEGRRLAENVHDAVASTAVIQVGALGLGTIVTMLATSSTVDVTGIMAAGALSVLGLLVLPAPPARRPTTELRGEGGRHARAADGRAHRRSSTTSWSAARRRSRRRSGPTRASCAPSASG